MLHRDYGRHLITILLALFIAGCGSSKTSTPAITYHKVTLTANGKPAAGAHYSAVGGVEDTSGTTDTDGIFEYTNGSVITIKIGTKTIGTITAAKLTPEGTVSIESLVSGSTDPQLKFLPELLAASADPDSDYTQLPVTLADLEPLTKTLLTVNGRPVSGVAYRSGSLSGSTDLNGFFEQDGTQSISFSVAGLDIGTAANTDLPTSIEALVSGNTNPVIQNLADLIVGLNASGSTNYAVSGGLRLHDLEQQLFKPDSLPASRLLGMNLETPQAEADGIIQPTAPVDLFRLARPFAENSCQDIEYDEHKWPIKIPESCATDPGTYPGLTTKLSEYATTRILQFANADSLREGRYHVFYDGTGKLSYSGLASNAETIKAGHDQIDITVINPVDGDLELIQWTKGLILSITETDATDPIRNIRIVPTGGICKGNPFTYQTDATACDTPYIAFADILESNRNAILFNPDFLNFYKDFRVLRMMNFMETTPRRPENHSINPCLGTTDSEYRSCVTQSRSWDQRATLDDASWGGSHRTVVTERFGVPLEVAIALSNLLQAHPWLNIPHNADDNYVEEYAKQLANELDDSLQAHIEYSNEIWNSGFWAHNYTSYMGADDPVISAMDEIGTRGADYSNRVRYIGKRAKAIFTVFADEFGGADRIKRILGGQHKFPSFALDALKYNGTASVVDAVAIGPYFHGCWNRERKTGVDDDGNDIMVDIASCSDPDVVPQVLADATTEDDVFEVIDGIYNIGASTNEARGDTNSLDATIKLVKAQADSLHDAFPAIDLYAYEGGQHLTVDYSDTTDGGGSGLLTDDILYNLDSLFVDVNRNPEMGERYKRLLEGWKEAGGKQFVLFTSPQSFNRAGYFGIKEALNASREESPKYDAALTFQETLNNCWSGWIEDGC